MEADQNILCQEAREVLPQLYPKLFEVVAKLPSGYFLATEYSDPALQVWYQHQESKLNSILETANTNNDYSQFVDEYQKNLAYIAEHLGKEIQLSSYKRVLNLLKDFNNQNPFLTITNVEAFVKELKDQVEAENFEEREPFNGIAMKNMYLFFANQLEENTPNYTLYKTFANQYKGDVIDFLERNHMPHDFLLWMETETTEKIRNQENSHINQPAPNSTRTRMPSLFFNNTNNLKIIVGLLVFSLILGTTIGYTIYQKYLKKASQRNFDKVISRIGKRVDTIVS